MQNQLDHDDCTKLRELAQMFNKITKETNRAIAKWMISETQIDKAIIKYRIKDTLAWKKQMLELVAQQPQFDRLHTDYMDGKKDQKIADNVLKAIENELNAIKKTYAETPE